jgi:uncharacterized protein (TIGR00645 family)
MLKAKADGGPMERWIEYGLFASRWLLAPMYVGLACALLILVWTFLMELAAFAGSLPAITVDEAVLGVLALIDLSLAGNLILIVIFSGYESFVSRLEIADHPDKPEWQGKVDFAGLKLKLVASIVAISGIHLLKVFMDVSKYEADQIYWMVVIHIVFIASGVMLALMDWVASLTKNSKAK